MNSWVVLRALLNPPNNLTCLLSTLTSKFNPASNKKIKPCTHSIWLRNIRIMPSSTQNSPDLNKYGNLMTFALRNDIKCSIIRKNTLFGTNVSYLDFILLDPKIISTIPLNFIKCKPRNFQKSMIKHYRHNYQIKLGRKAHNHKIMK